MKLSEMKQLLAAEGIQLTKSLGQNFLHDGNQLRRIVAAADLCKADKILEIGPGLGPLTALLREKAGRVLAIEKDGRLVELLRARESQEPEQDAGRGQFQLLQDDALEYLRRTPTDWADWKVVSNLPYSVASPILVELAQAPSGPARMVTTLQIEVARRLMAAVGDADYGLLTLLIQLEYEPVQSFKIPASCFFPAPSVDSACVVLARRARPLLSVGQRAVFVTVVKRSFSQRRKMMAKLLKAEWPAAKVERAFATAGVSPEARAEAVALEQFVILTRSLHE
jgi:16S rRNA (adenine1518-N6/adenine1519-N6)-dimethyltransferase